MKLLCALVFALCGGFLSPAFAEETGDCPPEWKGARPSESELTVCWRLRDDILRVQMSYPGNVWLALGFGESMVGADVIVGRPDTGEVLDMSVLGYEADSVVADARQDLVGPRFARFDGVRTTVVFSRALNTGDRKDAVLSAEGATPVIWAAGNAPEFVGHFARGMMLVNWGEGTSFAWSADVVWHAILMCVAFCLMMPLGVIIARYYKVLKTQDFPRELDNQFWWHWHLALQYGGMLLAAAGFFLIWDAEKSFAATSHAKAGYVALALGLLQVVGGLLRGFKGGPVDDNGSPNPPEKIRGDHYDMTLRRRLFEFIHKFGGYATLVAGFLAVALGVVHTDIRQFAFAALVLWLCALAGHVVYLRRNGRWVATYHAIWGMDARHPGNWVNTPVSGDERNEEK